MVKWLHSRELTNIRSFDFPKLKTLDRGKESNRRSLFEDAEILAIDKALWEYIQDAEASINHSTNLVKAGKSTAPLFVNGVTIATPVPVKFIACSIVLFCSNHF